MTTNILQLLTNISTLFTPLVAFASGNTWIGSLVIFSVMLTLIGSLLHLLLSRT